MGKPNAYIRRNITLKVRNIVVNSDLSKFGEHLKDILMATNNPIKKLLEDIKHKSSIIFPRMIKYDSKQGSPLVIKYIPGSTIKGLIRSTIDKISIEVLLKIYGGHLTNMIEYLKSSNDKNHYNVADLFNSKISCISTTSKNYCQIPIGEEHLRRIRLSSKIINIITDNDIKNKLRKLLWSENDYPLCTACILLGASGYSSIVKVSDFVSKKDDKINNVVFNRVLFLKKDKNKVDYQVKPSIPINVELLKQGSFSGTIYIKRIDGMLERILRSGIMYILEIMREYYGSNLNCRIDKLEECVMDIVIELLRIAGRELGIGMWRSVGFGRFDVEVG